MKQFIKKHDSVISAVAAVLLVIAIFIPFAVGATIEIPAALGVGCLCACPVLFFLAILPFEID